MEAAPNREHIRNMAEARAHVKRDGGCYIRPQLRGDAGGFSHLERLLAKCRNAIGSKGVTLRCAVERAPNSFAPGRRRFIRQSITRSEEDPRDVLSASQAGTKGRVSEAGTLSASSAFIALRMRDNVGGSARRRQRIDKLVGPAYRRWGRGSS